MLFLTLDGGDSALINPGGDIERCTIGLYGGWSRRIAASHVGNSFRVFVASLTQIFAVVSFVTPKMCRL